MLYQSFAHTPLSGSPVVSDHAEYTSRCQYSHAEASSYLSCLHLTGIDNVFDRLTCGRDLMHNVAQPWTEITIEYRGHPLDRCITALHKLWGTNSITPGTLPAIVSCTATMTSGAYHNPGEFRDGSRYLRAAITVGLRGPSRIMTRRSGGTCLYGKVSLGPR